MLRLCYSALQWRVGAAGAGCGLAAHFFVDFFGEGVYRIMVNTGANYGYTFNTQVEGKRMRGFRLGRIKSCSFNWNGYSGTIVMVSLPETT